MVSNLQYSNFSITGRVCLRSGTTSIASGFREITKKIKSSQRMILIKKYSPFLESIFFYFSKCEPNPTNVLTSSSLPSWRSRTIFDPTITPSDTALKRLMSSSVDTPKPVRTGMSAWAVKLAKCLSRSSR